MIFCRFSDRFFIESTVGSMFRPGWPAESSASVTSASLEDIAYVLD
jgi:hypothetical protein